MVNVFIIHSGIDYEYVKEEMEPFLCGQKGYANILTLESGKAGSWKANARRVIKNAQAVIVVLGSDANAPSKVETMGWEVREALKYNKLIMIYNRADYPLPSFMIAKDRFTGQDCPVADQMTLEQIKLRIDNYGKGYYYIFSPEFDPLDTEARSKHKEEILEQYKMYQKTSEDLVARRQSVSSFYLTVNSALVALVGVILGIVEAPTNLFVILGMAVIGIILDISWINLLDAYGTLNAAKMKVIHMMETQLPIALYDTEWQVMSDKLNNKRYISFTNSEKRIPIIFSLIYALILIIAAILLIVRYTG